MGIDEVLQRNSQDSTITLEGKVLENQRGPPNFWHETSRGMCGTDFVLNKSCFVQTRTSSSHAWALSSADASWQVGPSSWILIVLGMGSRGFATRRSILTAREAALASDGSLGEGVMIIGLVLQLRTRKLDNYIQLSYSLLKHLSNNVLCIIRLFEGEQSLIWAVNNSFYGPSNPKIWPVIKIAPKITKNSAIDSFFNLENDPGIKNEKYLKFDPQKN
jgi:hypothetical protein